MRRRLAQCFIIPVPAAGRNPAGLWGGRKAATMAGMKQEQALHTLAWGLALAGAAAVAITPAMEHLNRMLYAGLTPLGRQWTGINVVWVLGSLPVTAAAVALGGARRRGAAGAPWALGVLAAGLLVEAALKAALATPLPHPVSEPPWLAAVEMALNPSPGRVLSWLRHRGALAAAGGLVHSLRGSFPSGHTFRITLAVSACQRRPRWWVAAVIAAATGLAVSATGGHWAWDAVGGWLLASALAVWLPPAA